MAAYLVTYDLNREVVRPNITGAIKALGSWARLSESSYAVSSALSSEQIFGRLKSLIDSNDQLYVIPLVRPYAGYGPNEVNNWLENNLSYVRAA